MDPGAAPKPSWSTLIVQIVEAVGGICLILIIFGGPSTRAWMAGFFDGVTTGLVSEPSRAGQGATSTPPLRLLGHHCRQESEFQICEGEVRNTSDQRLENVMVEIIFRDGAGSFIKSDEAMIDYQPLMPGQTSPFKTFTTHNPMIRHYVISFKQMFGGKLGFSR